MATKDENDYQLLKQREHALTNPDMYIGDVTNHEPRTVFMYRQKKVIQHQVTHPRALDHLFVEVLGNAADNVWESREKNIDPKCIEINIDDKSCTVKNYGLGIPIMEKNGLWIPEMLFSEFMSGSNFKKKDKKYTIGKNGVGAKATNVFSKQFKVTCGDAERKLKYEQTWTDSMLHKTVPKVTEYQGENFVEVTYYPDFSLFGETCFTEDNLAIIMYYAISISFTYNIPVYVNNQKFHIDSIEKYAMLHFDKLSSKEYICHKSDEIEVVIIDTPCESIVSSFVNGIPTTSGGVHLDTVYSNLIPQIVEFLGKGVDGVKLTKTHVKSHLSIFVNCHLSNPKFKGQTKEELSSPTPKLSIPEKELEKIKKWSMLEYVHRAAKMAQLNKVKKMEKGKQKVIIDDNYFPCNWAGKKGLKDKTTLVYSEGQSASGYWQTFISCVPNNEGRNMWGIQCGHGKLINILNNDFKTVMENRDLCLLKEVLGLREEVDYSLPENIQKLNYGRFLISTDADNDGIHILCLLIVFFAFKFPGLLTNGFVSFYRTPLYRLTKGKKTLCFYTETSYDEYCANNESKGWTLKRYKGLATPDDNEVKEDYEKPKIVKLVMDKDAIENLKINFDSTRSKERGQILMEWMQSNIPDLSPYEELDVSMVLKHELPLYMKEAVIRHIPDHIDGLKDSQRMALFALFKMLTSDNTEVKVAQIASRATEITSYHHGSASMEKTITSMTVDYFCTNNLPFFIGKGAFGSRVNGGDDIGASRYIYVKRQKWLPYNYRKEDIPLLEHFTDVTGEEFQVTRYYPVIPMHPVNGVDGIGMGMSTFIPKHNIMDIALWLKQRLHNQELPFIAPYYKKFTGTFKIKDGKKFPCSSVRSYGKFTVKGNTITITELPVGKTNKKYEDFLNELKKEELIDDVQTNGNKNVALFTITGWKLKEPPSHKSLHLITQFSYENMKVIIPTHKDNFNIIHYTSINELLEDFFVKRLEVYKKRKSLRLLEIEKEITDINERIRFIRCVNEGELVILKRARKDIYADMDRLHFTRDILKSVASDEYSDEGIQHHQEIIAKKEKEREVLKSTTEEQIWENEIDEFVNYLVKNEGMVKRTMDDCRNDYLNMYEPGKKDEEKSIEEVVEE